MMNDKDFTVEPNFVSVEVMCPKCFAEFRADFVVNTIAELRKRVTSQLVNELRAENAALRARLDACCAELLADADGR